MLLIEDEQTPQSSNAWLNQDCGRERAYLTEDNGWSSRHAALYVKDWGDSATKEEGWDSGAVCYFIDNPTTRFPSEMVGTGNVTTLRALEVRNRAEELRFEFEVLAKRWQHDTKHFSQISRKITHQSFLRIIAMGYGSVPLILEALRDRPAHWFVALNAITNENPVPEGASPAEAREAWLAWGRSEGLVD